MPSNDEFNVKLMNNVYSNISDKTMDIISSFKIPRIFPLRMLSIDNNIKQKS